MPPVQDLGLALWQCPYVSDVGEALARLDQAAAQARAQGADLLVCPEMSLTGYAIGAQAVQALAEPADGPMAQAVSMVARHHGLAIVYGYPERHPDGKLPYNAVQMIDGQGHRLARYAKTHLFGDVDRGQFSPGSAIAPVFVWRGWRLGLLICYDVEFPETVRVLGLQGADLVLVPTANMRAYDAVPRLLVPARACENRLWVAYANACGQDAAFEYGGLSTVAGPEGSLLAQAGRDEALLCVRLQLADGQDARALGQWPCRRPELYQALVSPSDPG